MLYIVISVVVCRNWWMAAVTPLPLPRQKAVAKEVVVEAKREGERWKRERTTLLNLVGAKCTSLLPPQTLPQTQPLLPLPPLLPLKEAVVPAWFLLVTSSPRPSLICCSSMCVVVDVCVV